MSGYRPTRSQQIALIPMLQEVLPKNTTKVVVHHVLEDTPLKLVVQIEYRQHFNFCDEEVIRFRRIVL